jgi:sulfate permease, SulP family
MSQRLQAETNETGAARQPDVIEETSEPVTPIGKPLPTPASSHLAEALQDDVQGGQPQTYPIEDESEGQDLHEHSNRQVPDVRVTEDENGYANATERSPLLPRPRLSSARKQTYDDTPQAEYQEVPTPGIWNRLGHHYPSLKDFASRTRGVALNPKGWDFHQLGRTIILEPVYMLPAVFLGLLLNLLDALSYGIILFPLGEEIFSAMGADGVSMFYVSCIISQLTYSTGSIFRGGVGSEMIEVVPFFHKMTYMIMGRMGTGNPDAVRATVITSYAMSSIVTGIVFFALGSARLGTLVNFFPHSILTGCIGGVGIFLFITGIEVSARLDGNLEFTMEVSKKLFAADTVALWIPPLVLAIMLLTIKHFYDRPWLVPAYYIGITAIFYIITTAVPAITMDKLRASGWVFDAPAAGVPFYNFYSYYKFNLVDWEAIWMTVPSQLALTFFGILHVPINVPNLATVVQEDNVSINRELIMHGISNTLSGCVGSIQNYLVFVNSVLFMKTGGNTRLAGYLLAAATFGLWVAGPVVIGFVPVMVVGTLIYMLGIELAIEALVSTYGKLHRLEYFTIIIIAVVMGIYDFVVGIGIGIGLACLVYVVQTSRKTVIRAEFSGTVAESTVRRHPRQRHYLHEAGSQIRVVKLGGFLFFGSIVKVEKKVRSLIDAEAFAKKPIRYLILDLEHVTGIDFSAAEAFVRMNRILHRRDVNMAIAGVSLGSDVGKSLQMVGLFTESDNDPSIPPPKVFEDLNGALESFENELLLILTEKQKLGIHKPGDSPPIPIQDVSHLEPSPFEGMIGSPRRNFLYQAATKAITETREPMQSRWQNLKQPLPLILQAFQGLTDKNEDFWFRAVPYFTRREFTKGRVLYTRGDKPDGFYLLQSGILRAEYYLDQGNYHESIVAGTTCGELPFFSETERTSRVIAEQDCVAWLLTPEKWEELQKKDPEVARELLKVGLKLSAERMNAITSYVLITAS